MTDWRDLLAEQVRGLEAKAGYPDPLLAQKARGLLSTIRGYETRVRHPTLRMDYRLLAAYPAQSHDGAGC
jgi:hypothetical protein